MRGRPAGLFARSAGRAILGRLLRGVAWASTIALLSGAPMLPAADAGAQEVEAGSSDDGSKASSGDPWAGVEVMEVVGAGTAALLTAEVQTSAMGFDADELAAVRVADVRDIATITPNLEIKTGAGASNATIFIRGIGLNDFNANASSSVAIINDGVNVNSPAGQLFQLFDVEGSDVLRGPQGTLYGRNVTAGAIRVFSKKPGDDPDARFAFTYGNFDNVEAEGGLTVPIAPGLLSMRLSGKFRMRDGITKNRCADSPNQGQTIRGDCRRTTTPLIPPIPEGLPKWVNEIDNWGGRAILRFTPIDALEMQLNVHGGRSEGDARQNQARGTQGSSGVPPRFGVTTPFAYSDQDDDPYAGAYDIVANEYLELFGASITTRLDLGWGTLTSITAYEQNDRAFLDNTDGAPTLTLVVDLKDGARQWSEDLRLESTLDNGFEWKVGALFMTEKVFGNNRFQAAGSGLALPTRQRLKQQFFHGAIFGFASYELTETLKVEGGVRFGWERKEFKNRSWRVNLRTGQRTPDPPFSGKEEAEWSPVTGDAILTWSPIEDFDVYLKYARGWKTGHFNGGAARPDVLIDPVQPEHVNGFELGLNSEWLEGRIGLDAAIYYYDYKNYQVFALQNQPDGLPLPQLLNAQDVESRGFEIELRTVPWEGVRWNAALGWVEARFGTFTSTTFRLAQSRTLCGGLAFCSIPNNEDFTGNRLPAAPAFSFSSNVEADIPLGRIGVLTPRLDASYKTKLYFDHQGDEALSQGPFWLLHARLTYTEPGERISLSAWVKNLTDEAYLLQAFDLRLLAGTVIDTYGEPRTFGVTVALRY